MKSLRSELLHLKFETNWLTQARWITTESSSELREDLSKIGVGWSIDKYAVLNPIKASISVEEHEERWVYQKFYFEIF